MSRHSTNATAKTHFTYHEKQAAGHGTIKRRYGKDSQFTFGSCCLCLAHTENKNPLVSPSGFLYCKECIYANLLTQKRTIQENLEAYEKYCEKQENDAQDVIIANERNELKKCLNAANGTNLTPLTTIEETDVIKLKMQEKVDRTTDDVKREAMKRTSFWIPDCTPNAVKKVDPPDTKTRDPMNPEQELKLKHLMPVKFEWLSEDSDKSKYPVCAITKKSITHHQAVLLRPSGQVVLESCLKDMVLPTMTCPVTGLKLHKKKDIIKLQAGGTGFSAHSTVEAKKYRPSMT